MREKLLETQPQNDSRATLTIDRVLDVLMRSPSDNTERARRQLICTRLEVAVGLIEPCRQERRPLVLELYERVLGKNLATRTLLQAGRHEAGQHTVVWAVSSVRAGLHKRQRPPSMPSTRAWPRSSRW